jgi:small subunit ribosomal protein S8
MKLLKYQKQKCQKRLLKFLKQKDIFKILSRERVITKIKRVSKPGLRVYANSNTIPVVLGGLGISIVSTSKGVMTGKTAMSLGIGGEVLCYIW